MGLRLQAGTRQQGSAKQDGAFESAGRALRYLPSVFLLGHGYVPVMFGYPRQQRESNLDDNLTVARSIPQAFQKSTVF
ncbi:MAG TPA: hypothetical protein VLG17_17580 [Pseudomonas sp.]|jgi:hypothetical protein|uniref:hypothetical protein n=1 Tax=Pseudomonas sp. TaxID=306 RepID=UPI002635E8CF|nr:hypothetical protein [Pseudomonas sp.]HSX89788.1 hypothetical protein [Pseudomonas sp.]